MENNAVNFFNKFKSKITEDKYLDVYKNNSEFTDFVTREINEIIREMGYTSQNEYFRIDATGWISKADSIKDLAKENEMNPHLWDLKIAVEHENNQFDWTDELIKLVHIRCPLKVIISYNYCDRRDDLEYQRLSFAAECMNKTDAFDNNSSEEYLIILGNCYSKNKDYTNFDYRGYIYNYEYKNFMAIKQ